MTISDASLLSYTCQNKFFGNFKFGQIKTYTVEGVVMTTSPSSPPSPGTSVGENWDNNTNSNISKIKNYAKDLKIDANVTVNGNNFGTCRIVSIRNLDNYNPSVAMRYSITFESYNSTADDLFGLDSRLKSNITDSFLIEDFDENFTFSIESDGFKSSSHNITIKYRDLSGGTLDTVTATDGAVNKAKNLAKSIFDATLNFTFLNTVFTNLNTVKQKSYYKESYDLVNNTCSFSREVKISQDYSSATSDHSYQHSFVFRPDGIVEITERGILKGIASDQITAYNSAKTDLTTVTTVTNLNTRINPIFIAYATASTILTPPGVYDTIFPYIISNKQTHNKDQGYIEYEITLTNDKKYYENGYRNEINENYSKSSDGITTLERNGIFKKINQDKSTAFVMDTELNNLIAKLNLSNTTDANLGPALNTFYDKDTSFLKNISKSITIPKYGNEMTYTVGYSDDKSLTIPSSLSTFFNKLEISFNDTSPSHMYTEYPISHQKTFLYAGGQTNLGARNITLNGIIKKTIANASFGTDLISPFLAAVKTYLIGLFLVNLNQQNISVKDVFITNCSYRVNSNFEFTFSIDINYVSLIVENDSTLNL